ncbi:MAG TPA: amidohydrolase [Chryseosolibacter sp.]|nr:amidohydrolase [Chryseosolibacter sp.]
MLIDINSYIGHWPFRQRKYNTCATRLERMNRFGVDLSIVSNLNGVFYKNPQSANEELHHEIRSSSLFGDRFIPFAVINPAYAAWRSQFETSTGDMGMKGIRLYPQYHGYELTNTSCVELVKRSRDRGLPVAFSLRMVDSRPSSWLDLGIKKEWVLKDVVPIIRAVPDAKYLILNVANSTLVSEEDTALLKDTDLLIDTSGRNILDLSELIRTFGKDKFAFGTHAPILDDVTGLLRIESLRADEADKVTKELMRSGNAKRMLGL